MNENLKVKVVAYKDFLIIVAVKPKADPYFVPQGGTRIGCVLIETDKYLGMSQDAFKLLKTMKKSGDDIGDVSTWKTDKGKHCFAWIGGIKRLVNVPKSETDNKGIIDIDFIEIPNDIPPDALEAIITSQ
jgi:hypothetical protein